MELESSLISPKISGFSTSTSDFTQVILHQMEHGRYRRDQPFKPAPKPIVDHTVAEYKPCKSVETGRKFHIAPDTAILESKSVPHSIPEEFVMQVVIAIDLGEPPLSISKRLGVTRETVSRIKQRRTAAAVNCWARYLAEKTSK